MPKSNNDTGAVNNLIIIYKGSGRDPDGIQELDNTITNSGLLSKAKGIRSKKCCRTISAKVGGNNTTASLNALGLL